MNYYNPYYFVEPSSFGGNGFGIFNRGTFSFSSLLDGAQKTLGVFNQALPLIKEAAPLMKNAKTMFKVMNEFKKVDDSAKGDLPVISDDASKSHYSGRGPTFFA